MHIAFKMVIFRILKRASTDFMSKKSSQHLTMPAEIWATSFLVGIVGDKLLGPIALPSGLRSAVYCRLWGNDLAMFLEHASLSMATRVHARWDTTCCPHCQTAPQPDFWSTVDRR
jgi:hypothetical protein